jgi:pimeloyl-ACP methyl ester carboxylesterase
MKSYLVETPGGRTQTRVLETGAGPTLLYLHSAGGVVENDPFLEALGQHFHVYAPSLPGYLDSEGADNLRTMLDFTLWGFDVMEVLGIEHPVVVGHSMGGMIAAEMASLNPRAFKGLGLISAAGLWLDDYPMPDIFAKLPFELPDLLFSDPALGTQIISEGYDFGSNQDELVSFMTRFQDETFLQDFLIKNARRMGTAGKILFPIPERGLSERLYRATLPTVIVWGDADKLMPMPYAEAFLRLLPHAELVTIAGAAHMAPYEQTGEVLSALGRFH